jgi:hypothetical protein
METQKKCLYKIKFSKIICPKIIKKGRKQKYFYYSVQLYLGGLDDWWVVLFISQLSLNLTL